MENKSHTRIKIVAEGETLRALRGLTGGEPLTGDFIEGCDLLFVYAHSLLSGAGQRGRHGGLRKLQQLTAHASSLPAEIIVLGFLPASAYGTLGYLVVPESPCRYVRLPAPIPPVARRVPTADQWRTLTRRASEEELEIQCSVFRHGLQSVMAAARIYLGAVIAGHVDPDAPAFGRTLDALRQAASRAGGALPADVVRLVEASVSHRQRFLNTYEDVFRPGEVDLWVLDDNWKTHGWEIVFQQLPFRSVVGFDSWGALKSAMESSGDARPSVLMVDCNLVDSVLKGETAPTGLELLGCIRNKWQEVRIIFSTAYDDAALALTSLREGANYFFAKQLNDTGDRRSLSYYKQLMSLMKPHEMEARAGSWWREFSNRDASQVVGLAPWLLPDVQPGVELDYLLRLGFFLLFSFIDDDVYWRGDGIATSGEKVYRSFVNLVEAGYTPHIRNDKVIKREALKIVKAAAHGEDITSGGLNKVLTGLLKLLKKSPSTAQVGEWSPANWRADWPYSREDLLTDSTYPGAPSGAPVAPHDSSDEQGAVELARGIYCGKTCEHEDAGVAEIIQAHAPGARGKSYKDVAFIDDRGDVNGWFDVLRAILPDCQTYAGASAFLQNQNLSSVNLVLLDLKLSTFAEGFEALRMILAQDDSVPVITTSASSSSLEAIRSLRRGASDFISKSVPYRRDLSACRRFAKEFVRKCALMRAYGRSNVRRWWERLRSLRAQKTWDAHSLNKVRQSIAACEQHKKECGAGSGRLTPPDPTTWGGVLADELTMLLRIRQRLFLAQDKNQAMPLDDWRWGFVLLSKDPEEVVKLTAILAGLSVERLAMWHWCIASGKSLLIKDWGATSGINIKSTVGRIGGQDAKDLLDARNDALKQRTKGVVWDEKLCDTLIARTFATVGAFGEAHDLPLF